MLPSLRLRRREDLLWVTLDDPERANAFSPALIDGLTGVFRQDLRSQGVRAVLLGAAGKHFSGGADLAHLGRLRDASLDENREDSSRLRDLFAAVLHQEALTVALVQGACIAGGCGLATACDFVLAAPGAKLMYSEVKIGFVAALVATYLPLRVRGSHLRELLLAPELLSARDACEIGLINQVVEPREEEDAVSALARAGEELAAKVLTEASSESIARTKALILDVLGRPLDEALDRAAEVNAQARLTEDCRRGIGSFLETKKPPRWR